MGIITERDVLRRVVADRKDPAAAEVSSIMTTKLTCGRLDMPVGEAREIMRSRRIRHLPIVEDDGTVLGMISIGDLNAHQLDGQQQTIQYMHEYLYGGAS